MKVIKLILHLVGVVLVIPWCAIWLYLFVLACDLFWRSCKLLFLRLCGCIKSLIVQTKTLVLNVLKKLAQIWNGFLFSLFVQKEQLKRHSQKYKTTYITIFRLVIILALSIGYVIYHSPSCTYEWKKILDGNHWCYVTLVVIEVIYAIYLICVNISNALDEARLLLQESWQNFSGDVNRIGLIEIWNQLLVNNNNLFNSIWVVFVLILFPCALFVDGLAILTQIHIGAQELLNISMAFTSVILALFSLAFAKNVQKKTDDSMAEISQKIDKFSSWYEGDKDEVNLDQTNRTTTKNNIYG